LQREAELAQAIDGTALPDSEPADCVWAADANGELITDPQTMKAFLASRRRAVALLEHYKRRPPQSPLQQQEHQQAQAIASSPLVMFEVKSLDIQREGVIRMSRAATRRKEGWARRYACEFFTVGFDDRKAPTKFSGNRLYLKRGVGNMRLRDMTPARDFDHLLELAGQAMQAQEAAS
jgi:hypothetical protein